MHPLDNQIGQLPLPKEEHVQELTKSEHQPDQSDNGCMERIKTFFYEGCYSFLKFIVGSIISIKVPESTLIPTTDTDITVTTETLIATTSLPEDYEEEVNELKLLLDITSSLLQAGEEIMQMTGKQRDLQPQQQNNAANNQKKQENYQSKSESDSTMNQVWTKEDIEHRRSLRVIRSPTDTFECRNFTSYCTLVIHKRQLQILGNGVEALIKLLNETETVSNWYNYCYYYLFISPPSRGYVSGSNQFSVCVAVFAIIPKVMNRSISNFYQGRALQKGKSG